MGGPLRTGVAHRVTSWALTFGLGALTGFVLVVVWVIVASLAGPQRSFWPGVLGGLVCLFIIGKVSGLLAHEFHTGIVWPLLGGLVIFLGFFVSLLLTVGTSLDPY
jgi:hypothetical protein